MDHAVTSSPRPATDLPLAGPTDHPMIAMPFHVEIDGRQYRGRSVSLVRAEISGLMDPHSARQDRVAWVVFRFQGFTVGLSIDVRIEEVDAARGTAALAFLDPTGEHLPQLRHLLNAHIAGDLVTLGNALAVSAPAGVKPKAGPASRSRLRGVTGSALLVALTVALVALVTGQVVQRAFTRTLAAPVSLGHDGRTLAATATGQIDFLNPEAQEGEVAFAIRSNTGQALSVVMPCTCRVETLGVEAGSTVFAGDPVLRVSADDAGLVATGAALPDELLDLARAGGIDLRLADGSRVTARLAPGGLGSAAQARGSWVAAHHTSRQVQPIRPISSQSQSSRRATIFGQIRGSSAGSPPCGP